MEIPPGLSELLDLLVELAAAAPDEQIKETEWAGPQFTPATRHTSSAKLRSTTKSGDAGS